MRLPWKKPRPALHVRIQHQMLDNAAIEGLWVGEVTEGGQTYLHLRLAKTVVAGEPKPFRHGEILVPEKKVVFMEVLGVDANPHPQTLELGTEPEAD